MENHVNKIFIVIPFLLLTGCTSIKVQKLETSAKVSHVCIEENTKVIVRDFLPVIQKGFKRHGITTETYEKTMPNYCEYHLTYTALKNWDIAMYMHHAELWLYRGKENIAYAEYHLNGKGGLALNKWASVDSKMDPVINQLLSGYSPEMVDAYRKAIPTNKPENLKSVDSTENQLRKLKKWLAEGLITQKEYESEKQKLLAK